MTNDIASLRQFIVEHNKELVQLDAALAPMLAAENDIRRKIRETYRTTRDPETGRVLILGYLGDLVSVDSVVFCGSTRQGESDPSGHYELRAQSLLIREGITDRLALFAELAAVQEEGGPWRAERRRVWAKIQAAERALERALEPPPEPKSRNSRNSRNERQGRLL